MIVALNGNDMVVSPALPEVDKLLTKVPVCAPSRPYLGLYLTPSGRVLTAHQGGAEHGGERQALRALDVRHVHQDRAPSYQRGRGAVRLLLLPGHLQEPAGTQYAVHRTQYTVHRTQCTVHSTQYTVHSTQCTVHSTQYTPPTSTVLAVLALFFLSVLPFAHVRAHRSSSGSALVRW